MTDEQVLQMKMTDDLIAARERLSGFHHAMAKICKQMSLSREILGTASKQERESFAKLKGMILIWKSTVSAKEQELRTAGFEVPSPYLEIGKESA